jgi:predicted RNase H-like HicB family nuclease
MKVRNTYTAIIKKGEQGYYFGWIEQVPEAMSQGTTMNELLENLKDALSLVLEDKKTEAMKITIGQKVTRRKIVC